jgi:hypothetical protein
LDFDINPIELIGGVVKLTKVIFGIIAICSIAHAQQPPATQPAPAQPPPLEQQPPPQPPPPVVVQPPPVQTPPVQQPTVQPPVQRPPNIVALEESQKAAAAIEALRIQLKLMLESDEQLDPATREQISIVLQNSDTAAAELSRIVYAIVRDFRGDRVLGAISWGLGGERTWKLPSVKSIGPGIGVEASAGLAFIFLRHKLISLQGSEVAGYYSYGPHLATGFHKPQGSVLKNRGGKQMFPIFRLFFARAQSEVSHSGDLSGWYAGFAFEIPWKLYLKGTFQAQLYGNWKLPRENTTEEIKRRLAPDIIMAAIAPGVGAQDSGLSFQIEGQYVQFVGFQNK